MIASGKICKITIKLRSDPGLVQFLVELIHLLVTLCVLRSSVFQKIKTQRNRGHRESIRVLRITSFKVGIPHNLAQPSWQAQIPLTDHLILEQVLTCGLPFLL